MVELDEESQWIERSRAGDQDAFEQLILRYQRMVYSLAYRMTGTESDAEDLAQETFIQAFRHFESYRGDSRFSSWIYRIAMNLCLNWRKRGQTRELAYRQWGEERMLEASAHPTAPSDSDGEQVQMALLKLPAKQRAALVLTFYDGLNHGEAARVLGCSETTVSWRVFAAKAKLKHLLRHCESRRGGANA